jgi:Phage integrase family
MMSSIGIWFVTVIVRDARRSHRPTCLLLVDGEPVWPLLEYFRSINKGLSTERSCAFGVGLLVDYIATRGAAFRAPRHRANFFNEFSHAVVHGTIVDGDDPTGLWWQSRRAKRAKRLLDLVCGVSDWLTERFAASPVNPFSRPATASEQIAFWRSWNHQKSTSLLNHVKERSQVAERATFARTIAFPVSVPTVVEETLAFPEDEIGRLLFTGFLVPGHQTDSRAWMRWHIRDILVTLLLHFGGLRISEPMHLWVDDVYVDPADPTCALVLVHHPREGVFDFVDPLTGAKRPMLRETYLKTFRNRRPLTDETGHRKAGWKEPLLTHRARNAFHVFWSVRGAGRLFLDLYRIYIGRTRHPDLTHPFLFVTEQGEPMGTDTFRKNHAAALERIGITPARYLGTTPHGHRHAYGQKLREYDVNKKIIQVALHHRNPKSQERYTQTPASEVSNAMCQAEKSGFFLPLPFELPRLIGGPGAIQETL